MVTTINICVNFLFPFRLSIYLFLIPSFSQIISNLYVNFTQDSAHYSFLLTIFLDGLISFRYFLPYSTSVCEYLAFFDLHFDCFSSTFSLNFHPFVAIEAVLLYFCQIYRCFIFSVI